MAYYRWRVASIDAIINESRLEFSWKKGGNRAALIEPLSNSTFNNFNIQNLSATVIWKLMQPDEYCGVKKSHAFSHFETKRHELFSNEALNTFH